MKSLYRAAHQSLLGFPAKGEALEMIHALTADTFPEVSKATSLRQAREILNAEIAAVVEQATQTEMLRVTEEFHRLQKNDYLRYLPQKEQLEREVQHMIFDYRNPKIHQAQKLLYALLDHSHGPKAGFSIYKINMKWNAPPVSRPA